MSDMAKARKRLLLASLSLDTIWHALSVRTAPIRFGHVLSGAYQVLGLHHCDHLIRK